MAPPDSKTKALVVATRCTSVEQFVATFHRFCDDSSFFVSTLSERPIGLETAFSIQLVDRTPVLRGLCTVVEAWSTPLNRFGRPGVRLAVKRLTNESVAVFKLLQVARATAEASPAPELPMVARTATTRGVTRSTPPKPVAVASPPSSPSHSAPARPATGSTSSPALGAPIARLPLGRSPIATPFKVPRIDPRVSEAPSLPRSDDRSGPVVAPPLVAPPTVAPPRVAPPLVAPEPAPPAPRTAPNPAPSIIVGADVVAEPPARDVPEPIAANDDMTNPVAVESRTPGSSYVLPANPLSNLTDQSLGGFVDCALYEETGNFFRAPGYEDSLVDIDDVAAPPGDGLSPVHALRQEPGSAPPPMQLSPMAFSPVPDHQFAPEATPLPMLAPQRDPPPRPYTEPLVPNGVPPSAESAAPAPQFWAPPMSTPGAVPEHRVAPTDSTASLLAMSSPNRRRWLVFGGGAVAASVLVLAIVIARTGGDDPKPAPVKVATVAPTAAAQIPHATVPPPTAGSSDATTPLAVPATVTPSGPPTAKLAAEPVAVVSPDEPSGPPVVGTGPCRLTVSSTPAGSIVRIDDQAIGPSPITFAGPCKRRRVDVKHPRYALGTKWVNLAADKPAEIQVPLVRPTHAITIVTIPPGATISIAGNRAGTSPTSVKVMGFTGVKLSVEKKGFKPVVQKVYSKVDGERIQLKLVRGK